MLKVMQLGFVADVPVAVPVSNKFVKHVGGSSSESCVAFNVRCGYRRFLVPPSPIPRKSIGSRGSGLRLLYQNDVLETISENFLNWPETLGNKKGNNLFLLVKNCFPRHLPTPVLSVTTTRAHGLFNMALEITQFPRKIGPRVPQVFFPAD